MASTASIPSSFATLPEEKLAQCCFPNGACLIGTLVDVTSEAGGTQANNGSSANRMYCTNSTCDQQSRYIHTHCLEQLENQLTQKAKKVAAESKDSSLKGLGDKQVRQNIWNCKPALEQIYSSLNCPCGKGHLTRDSSADQGGDACMEAPFQIVSSGNKRGSSGSKKRGFAAGANTNQSSTRSGAKIQGNHSNSYSPAKINQTAAQSKQISRIRNSLSASDMTAAAGGGVLGIAGGGTASSSPGATNLAYSPDSMSPRSAGSSSHLSSSKWMPPGHSNSPPTSGRLSRRVDHMSIQAVIDPYRYNIYHIRTEDDLPSDEYKEAFFQTLRSRSMNMMNCVVCNKRLNIYDRYPLIDGCIFISPIKHHTEDRSIPFTINNNKQMFVSCVCIRCLQGNNVICLCVQCGREWMGVAYQIGVIYPFDIFAPNVCCSERSKCSYCEKQLVSSTRPLPQKYPEFSHMFPCPSCHEVDSHFVKPLQRLFRVQQNSSIQY